MSKEDSFERRPLAFISPELAARHELAQGWADLLGPVLMKMVPYVTPEQIKKGRLMLEEAHKRISLESKQASSDPTISQFHPSKARIRRAEELVIQEISNDLFNSDIQEGLKRRYLEAEYQIELVSLTARRPQRKR